MGKESANDIARKVATQNRAKDWVWKLPHLTCQQRCVLAAISEETNTAGVAPWISTKYLAAMACLSDRQLRRILRQVVSYGALIIEQNKNADGSYTTNSYYLQVTRNPVDFLGMKTKANKGKVHLMRHDGQMQEVSYAELSAAFMDRLRDLMPDRVQEFQTWLRLVKILKIEKGGRVKLIAPNSFYVDHIERHLSDILLQSLKSLDPRVRRFEFVTSDSPLA